MLLFIIMKNILFTNSSFEEIVTVYMYMTLFTNILTLECMLGNQSLGAYEVSVLYPLRYFEKYIHKMRFNVIRQG